MSKSLTNVQKKLQKALDYQFQDLSLLAEALTHASMKGKKRDNERLEFLGDRVLGLVIAKRLYHKFPEASEGILATKQAHLVSRDVLSKVADKLDLNNVMIMAKGERISGALKKKSLIANACEAIIAALFLDGGFIIAEKFILTQWAEELIVAENLKRDSKSLLQEWAQSLNKGTPLYIVDHQTGPQHDPIFEISVFIEGFEKSIGKGASKREAEQKAAKIFLQRIEKI